MADNIVPTYTIALNRKIAEHQREYLFDTIHEKFDAVAHYQFSFHPVRLNWYGDSAPVTLITFTCVKDDDAMDRFEFALKLKYNDAIIKRTSQQDYISEDPATHERLVRALQTTADACRGHHGLTSGALVDMFWARLKG